MGTVYRCKSIAVLILLVLSHADALDIPRQRPLGTDDLFRLEEVGDVALSPDGKWLAYVIKRPKSMTTTDHKLDPLGGNDRADVWVVETRGGQPDKVTQGAADGSGYWNPVWSPDGGRLAMLSTRGGSVWVWVWERATGRLRQIAKQGVGSLSSAKPLWISDRRLALSVLPEGQGPLATVEKQAAEAAIREWPKAWKGREATASVLESGVPASYDRRPQGKLLTVDLDKGISQIIARGNYRELRLSPDKRHLALLKRVDVVSPNPKQLIRDTSYVKYQLMITSSEGKLLSVRPADFSLLYTLVSWSPDGKELALMVRGGESPRVYRYRLTDGILTVGTGDDLKIADDALRRDILWSSKSDLIVCAERIEASPVAPEKRRSDWWAMEAPGRYRNLTASMKSVPAWLVPEAGGESFVGTANGELWRISAGGAVPKNLTEGFEPRITSLVWPRFQDVDGRRFSHLVVGSSRGTETDLYRVDLSSDDITHLPKPKPEAELVAFAPENGVAVITSSTREGTNLWISLPGNQESQTVVETNTFLREIAEGQLKKIEYRSLDGKELKGWVILPVDYQEGKRYPMVVSVYAGYVTGDVAPLFTAMINSSFSLNLQLLAARGYTVLLPSMPLKPEGEASDPYMQLTNGVLPAVDKVIELGIADPKRVGVMGHSYGGYSTYGLITQTNRFQAAVALSGPSDLISMYGAFDARFRYDEFPHEYVFRMWLAESGQFRMGNPPWKDVGRYLRNSPIFYVDRVGTPLMIIQGDMDFVAILQGEQFFTALYRQGKRASFVRYWGEGHVLESPANVRDMWHRIFAWFDEFLDVSRDQKGNFVWDGEKVRSRNGSPPLKPEDFARFNEITRKESQRK